MQNFGDSVELLKSWARRATHMYANGHNHTREYSLEEQLLQFQNQIVMVQETQMARLRDGFIPRILNRWLKSATDLESHVSQTLKDPSPEYNGLKEKMLHNMKVCPIEDADDIPADFIAPMLEAAESEDGDLQAQDVETKEVASSAITVVHENGILIFVEESYGGAPLLKIIRLTSETAAGGGGETHEADESSHVHDVVISQVQEFGNKSEEPKGKGMIEIERHEEMPNIGATNPPEVSIHQDDQSVDDIGFARVGESELGMTFKFVLSMCLIRLQTLSMSSRQTQETTFDLGTAMDNYHLFSATREAAVELEENGVIVNRNGSKPPREMPTAEEWSEARVVNLIERKAMLLNDEAPNCPNLLILFLQRNSRLTRIPPSFFNQMPRLHFLDLSDTRIKALPSSLFKLRNLRVLLLRSCVCLDSLPAEVKNLSNLEVLDLLGTDLPDLPKEVRTLTKLRHLQISFHQPNHGSSESELVSSRAISPLRALQGLSISVHPKDQQWERIVGDVIEQIVELEMLSYLLFYFPSVEALVQFSQKSPSWREKRLRRFSFVVGQNIKRIISRVPEEVESEYEKYDQCLRLVNSGNEKPELMKGILESVTAFYLDHHLEIQSLSEFDVSSFAELKFCVLRECPNMQVVIIGEKRNASFFPKLEYLGLHYLWNLERIWEDDPTPGSYQALKYLRISTCGKLEYVASHSVFQCLSNLETFIVEDCESLRSIVKEDAMVKGAAAAAALLPRLKTLLLRHLPELVALGRGLFPSKGVIDHQFCPKFMREGRISELKKKLSSLPHMAISSSALMPKLEFKRTTRDDHHL